MKQKAIGIIGGMGPEASEQFYGLLIRHAQRDYGVKRNDEFPEVYLVSVPVPDFITDTTAMEQARMMLTERVKLMDTLPIGLFCMACNTGHLLLPDMQKATRKPFVSLLEEVPAFIRSQSVRRVGLLATPTTIKTGMYQSILRSEHVEVVVPNEEDTAELGTIITDTVAGKRTDENVIRVQEIARRLLDRGAEAILEGCTEIPLIFPKQHLVPVYDTLEILADAVLKKYYSVQ